jgi:MoxR-like ATPase
VTQVTSAGLHALLSAPAAAAPGRSKQLFSIERLQAVRAPAPRPAAARLTRGAQVRDDAARVVVPPAVLTLLADLRAWIQRTDAEGGVSYLSDRRLTKAITLLKVAAFTSGRDEVALHDCLLLEHVMWSRPEQAPVVRDWLLAHALPDACDADISVQLDAAYLEVRLVRLACVASTAAS